MHKSCALLLLVALFGGSGLGWFVDRPAIAQTQSKKTKKTTAKATPVKAKKKVKATKKKAVPANTKKKTVKATPVKTKKRVRVKPAPVKASRRTKLKTLKVARPAPTKRRTLKVKARPKPAPPKIVLEGEPVRLLNYTLFTLYAPKGSGQATTRARLVENRLTQLLKTFAEKPLEVQAFPGPGKAAQVMINNQSLVTLTQYELLGNGAPHGLGPARQWAGNLRQILNKGDIQDAYFTYAGLPSLLNLGGVTYQMNRQLAKDYGLFTTDGTQQQERVVYWRDGEQRPFQTIYLLNRNRQFVVYAARQEQAAQ
ncbi:hypothetical protein [Candidatus Cyanaurora vandensis]|uniref:hypothetical protein n=1 Tax=Candidatus Cyanaurora vandensis TaxID=2714958 RepID=UPI00257ED703|nr:hypothetical protein [Candidatus Cyanaurora vandensis]